MTTGISEQTELLKLKDDFVKLKATIGEFRFKVAAWSIFVSNLSCAVVSSYTVGLR